MCDIIDAENLLMNYFASDDERSKVTCEILETLKCRIEAKLDDVYVDISSHAVRSVVLKRFNEFEMLPTEIKLIAPHQFHERMSFEVVDSTYNWRIPQKHKETYIELLRDYGRVDG